jgi:hypothetical protein
MKERYTAVAGRQEGQPEVLVRDSVLRRWGEPTVDFDGLADMAREAGLEPGKTKIKLYSGRWTGGSYEFGINRFARGRHIPFTNTIYSGVGPNGAAGLPHRSELPEEVRSELGGGFGDQTATMGKLVHNVLRAAGVRGSAIYEKQRELYRDHAGDIQFENPSPEAR